MGADLERSYLGIFVQRESHLFQLEENCCSRILASDAAISALGKEEHEDPADGVFSTFSLSQLTPVSTMIKCGEVWCDWMELSGKHRPVNRVRAYPGSDLVVANTLAKWQKL